MTARATPGSESDRDTSWPLKVWPWRIACPVRKPTTDVGSITSKVTPLKTAAFAQRTGSRLRAGRECGSTSSSSGERALEGGPVEGATVRLEQVFHRQREQRPQAVDDLLARHACAKPAGIDLRAFAEVGERVAS